jgi:dTDP-glucose pyrophosphorylase
MRKVGDVCLTGSASVREALGVLDASRAGIVLVVDEARRLIGTLTDGDVRRAIIAGRSLEVAVTEIMCRRPIVAGPGDSNERIRELLDAHRLRHVPVVDADGVPTRLCELQDLVHRAATFPFAVILAGGEGRRLLPLTADTPKPMLKVGDMPILERLVRTLVDSGIADIYISVNYRADVIESAIGDGHRLGARVRYLHEGVKLGTAGPLSLLRDIPPGPFLVVNGDIVTTYDFKHLYDYHWRHRCVITVGAIEYKIQVPYGTLRLAGHYLLGLEEKPIVRLACAGGIYAINPEVLSYIPRDRKFDMTDLLEDVVRDGLPVSAFAIHENWLDVGQPDDLAAAQARYRATAEPPDGARG